MMNLGDSGYDTASTPLPVEATWRPSPALVHAGFTHDPDVPVAALGARSGDRVFVADAYGGAESALAHLVAAPSRVVVAAAFDPEGVGAVLRLEAAAHARLDRLEALRLLGLLRASRTQRLVSFDLVAPALSPGDVEFWDRHADALTAGLYQGSAEVALGRLLRDLLRAHLAPEVYRALLYGSREERVATFARHLDRPGFWRHALRLCAMRGRMADAGDGAVSAFTHGEPTDALRALVRVGLPCSPVWARAFDNDAGVLAVLPAHLREAGHAAMRLHLDRLEVRADAPGAVLATEPAAAFDGVDLGHLPEYLDPESRRALLLDVARVARPGARVAVATLDPVGLRALAPAALEPLAALEDELAGRDRAPVWGHWCVFVVR